MPHHAPPRPPRRLPQRLFFFSGFACVSRCFLDSGCGEKEEVEGRDRQAPTTTWTQTPAPPTPIRPCQLLNISFNSQCSLLLPA
ncbi:hypothetical protein E2C01_074742 [Portunus trituberculatus]|uniref:Secreted protein n=1 Tax=Portunus trituberculatus TaxID=210409 RepID=A0A5B7ID21_PORTR|nr:hypothetical protein [Portunus trituberculatus]